ncbi:MAG: endopeptidase La [Candidatus Roseilinea sp.]|uniref:endopeptidase La n=1 Tax=Candidatus Roseilinea sp. TaxID=2838777 RepID=UPI00404B6FAB
MAVNHDYMTPDIRNWLMAASFGDGLPSLGLESTTQSRDLPEIFESPVLPLRDMVVFPRAVTPLTIGRDRSLRAMEVATATNTVVTVAQRNTDALDPKPSDMYTIGTVVDMGRALRMPDGVTSLLVRGRARVRILEWLQATPFMVARVQVVNDRNERTPATEALMRAVLALFEKVVRLNQNLPEEAYIYALNVNEPGWLADLIAHTLPLNLEQRQLILETVEPVNRLQKLGVLLAKELDVLELEDRIALQVQNEVDKSPREMFLREQMKAIQTELGESDAGAQDVLALRERLKQKKMPEAARAKAQHEIDRLARMDGMSPEIAMTRAYIEWLLDLPWFEQTEDNLDVKHAERVLNERHYGLTKVKERVLEYIAVRKLTGGQMHSPIICFVGPPGTGKTSLARSIADSLGRRFVRMSVGGVHDEAEIRGHRRTYIGALPGRILQAMRRAGTINPLFVLDEIDKMGEDFRGDPAAALLEVLDPEQNCEFEDHYLDVVYDLSKVLWITTANWLDPVPAPLRDRMEIIEFPGYLEEEKLQIAKQFLVPRQIAENGLREAKITFTDEAIRHVIREYTYEAGVRNLERQIGTICRKIARRLAENQRYARRITAAQLHKYLGPPQFDFSMLDEQDQIGVANGVAWTEAGGDLMPVEVTLMDGKGSLTLTGQLGDVMQESAQAALSYARSIARRLGMKPNRFEKTDIHIHVAEGAVPKDGPSAGITIAAALISALTKVPVRRDAAMTGEITLRGRVLPIGGLKEKMMAAHRAGIRIFIMPKKNVKDLAEVPRKIQRDLKVVTAATMDEVLAAAMAGPLPAEFRANGARARSRSKPGQRRSARNTTHRSAKRPAPQRRPGVQK